MRPYLTQLFWSLISPREKFVFQIQKIARTKAMAGKSAKCEVCNSLNLGTGTFHKGSSMTIWLRKPVPRNRSAAIHIHQSYFHWYVMTGWQLWKRENCLKKLVFFCCMYAGGYVIITRDRQNITALFPTYDICISRSFAIHYFAGWKIVACNYFSWRLVLLTIFCKSKWWNITVSYIFIYASILSD